MVRPPEGKRTNPVLDRDGPRQCSELADLDRSRDKYECQNAIGRKLVSRFTSYLVRTVSSLRPIAILDVGCGDGRLTSQLEGAVPSAQIVACDVSLAALSRAATRSGRVRFLAASADHLPFGDACFDLVTGFEVLEHLEHPRHALAEMGRVASRLVALSVPDEPIWRALNLCRGKYVSALGNTPGHLHHWNARSLAKMVAEHLSVIQVARVLPWVVLVAGRKGESGAALP